MTPISEIIFSGFVSKVVNDIVDVPKDKIRRAVRNKNTKHQSIESQIYNVIVDVLNIKTNNQYENNQDSIYNAAEILLKLFKENDGDELECIKSCLRVLDLPVDENECLKFKVSLYKELGKEEYSELFRAILLLLLDQKNQYDNAVYEQLNQKLDDVILMLNSKKDGAENSNIKQKIKSRTQEYADKWDANMFLNDFDKRDENAGVNVKLSEVYLEEHLPHYIWGDNDENEPSTDLKELLSEYINEKRDSKMLLILGQPGIGKSTLITWIAAKFTEKANDILVYKFASDLGNINWRDSRVFYIILKELSLNYDDLAGKTLILDGFDEVSIEADKRRDILDSLYGNWIYSNTIKNFSLIITCRENYIQGFERLKCKYITLQPWDDVQINSFYKTFQGKTKNKISESTIEKLLENKKILGIPLILYMVLALNISIEKEGSIVDVYDKIFSLDGGIYDRCIENKMFADNHRVSEIKKQIHQISKDIAFWMFENNPEDANIPQEEYTRICDEVAQKSVSDKDTIRNDFFIGNYFNLVKHCEGVETERLYFVHRSVYEYFVVEAIFNSIENVILDLSYEKQETFISNISNYLKTGQLDNTMGDFFKYKISRLYYKMDIDKRGVLWKWCEVLIEKMMKRGMLYHVNGNMRRFDYMAIHEAICFYNIMYVLSLISDIYPQNLYLLSTIEKGLIQIYVGLYSKVSYYSMLYGINDRRLRRLIIRKTVFTGINYQELYLVGSDFCESNFTDQDFSKSILCSSNFNNAVMINTILREANLENASMKGTVLRGADLRGADLAGAKIEGVNLDDAKIEDSIWTDEDILEIRPLMQKAIFNYIKLQHIHGQERISREQLFYL